MYGVTLKELAGRFPAGETWVPLTPLARNGWVCDGICCTVSVTSSTPPVSPK